ncbi:MAG: hypothetical protein AAF456_17010 [Planctomycetota bacterium]
MNTTTAGNTRTATSMALFCSSETGFDGVRRAMLKRTNCKAMHEFDLDDLIVVFC